MEIKRQANRSSEFRTKSILAIGSIAFFILIYFILFSFTIGLTALCIYGAILLIDTFPRFISIALGIGLASFGLLIFYFLIKFVFSFRKIDRSNFYEIQHANQPEIFSLIQEIVTEVKTSFPKRVYLSTDVNAAVFYDSNFWSMFFPVKKNLLIGMGLLNSVSQDELKAVLAHEFGHFSQKSLKLSSYVYNVNQVIFNLVSEDESFDKIIQKWAETSGYLNFFIVLAVNIIEGIKWILQKLYEIVNKSYLGLSREMEFHADEIAVSIAGYEPFRRSLLRAELSGEALSRVLTFYADKISDNIRSENVYDEHWFVLNLLAKESRLPIVNGFPEVTIEEYKKFKKSKLVIKDQWASHPSISDRLERQKKHSEFVEFKHQPALHLFRNYEEVQKTLTNFLFTDIEYKGEIQYMDSSKFESIFYQEFKNNTFSDIYNEYYDNKNPVYFDLENINTTDGKIEFPELFSEQIVDLVHTEFALKNDLEIIKKIAYKTISLKTFDYDGKKYESKEGYKLITKLNLELEQVNSKIKENDIKIFTFFEQTEALLSKPKKLKEYYQTLFEYDQQIDSKLDIITKIYNHLEFTNYTTPFDKIITNFRRFRPLESQLKQEIESIVKDNLYTNEISKDMKDNFHLFLSSDLEYFRDTAYNNENLEVLFLAIENYRHLLLRGYFLLKKKLLSYQKEIIEPAMRADAF